jgi:hypothetical protein
MAGTYLKVEPAKEKTKWLNDNLEKCNRQIESDSADVIVSFPTDENGDMYKAFADAAAAWLKYQWTIFQSDKEGQDTALIEYKGIKDGIRTRAKSQPDTNRMPAISVSVDPRDLKMILPTQASIFAFDNFA